MQPAPSTTKITWWRAPEHDKRFAWGDDFAGDAWVHVETGKVRYCVVGYDPNNEELHDQRA